MLDVQFGQVRQEKEIGDLTIEKEEIKLFDDNMILYIENSKNQGKLLKLALVLTVLLDTRPIKKKEKAIVFLHCH